MPAAQTAVDSTRYRLTVLAMLTLVYTFNSVDRQILVILQEPSKRIWDSVTHSLVY